VYKRGTAVEQVNSWLDVFFELEYPFIRGLEKMKLRCSLGLCVMFAIELGRVRQKREEKLRSLVKAAA
jgi:hypothetical protein